MFTPKPLSEGTFYRYEQYDFNDSSNASLLAPVSDPAQYAMFRRNYSHYSTASYQYNYIYRTKRPLRIFDMKSERDVYQLFKAGVVDPTQAGRYWSMADIDFRAMAQWIAKQNRLEGQMLGVGLSDFRKFFDGYVTPRGSTFVFADVLLSDMTLVDGVTLRNDPGEGVSGFSLPRWVEMELERYTKESGKRIRPDAFEWLKENAPKPYSSIQVFRGFGTQLDDFGDYSGLTEAKLLKQLYSRTGLRNLTDVVVGAPLKLKRGKESSWSTVPEVATAFYSGEASKSLNFLVQAEIPSAQVLVDFTAFPREVRQKFLFHGQNEVIVLAGAIPAKISRVTVDKKFRVWLEEHGYEFTPQRGIFKKE